MKEWFKCAGIRAIKTVAQTAVATIGTAVALGDVKLGNGCVSGGIGRCIVVIDISCNGIAGNE